MNVESKSLRGVGAALCAAALVGCASGPSGPGSPTASQPPVAESAGGLFGSGLSDSLEPQRVRLQGLLKGTPVTVEATSDRQLHVSVPLRNSFDAGRSAVKPALAAVLDQLATGFKPYAATSELRINAPDDANAKVSGRLAKERGASVRDYLVARGIPLSRIATVGQTDQEQLDLLLSDRPLNK